VHIQIRQIFDGPKKYQISEPRRGEILVARCVATGKGKKSTVSYKRINKKKEWTMAGQGSTGNVIAALASFFIPGLGQLLQGRLLLAIIQFVLATILWIFLLGWIIHIWSILDAALYKSKG
jgi:TM2 domain-containing membrane protein YozV